MRDIIFQELRECNRKISHMGPVKSMLSLLIQRV